MRLPVMFGGIGPRDGEAAREHIQRLTGTAIAPVWGVKVLASYVVALLDRVDALERRVVALEEAARRR